MSLTLIMGLIAACDIALVLAILYFCGDVRFESRPPEAILAVNVATAITVGALIVGAVSVWGA